MQLTILMSFGMYVMEFTNQNLLNLTIKNKKTFLQNLTINYKLSYL